MKLSIKSFSLNIRPKLIVALFWFAACAPEPPNALDKDKEIKTKVVVIKSTSYDQPGYQAIPDSLRLRFDQTLRALRLVVKAAGCSSLPQASVEETSRRLSVQLNMQNGCVPVREEFFDVEVLIHPIHEDEFQLLVLAINPGLVLLSQPVDVHKLPGVN